MIVGDVVLLDVDLFGLGDAEAVDTVIEDSSRLMRFNAVQGGNTVPFFGFQGVPQAFLCPFVLLNDASHQVEVLIVVDQAV